MKTSELYQHKAEYDEINAVLEKHKELPFVNEASLVLFKASRCISHFEKWHIDCYMDREPFIRGCLVYTGKTYEIANQVMENGVRETLKFDEPKELLRLWFSTGAYALGENYYTDLFDEFFSALKAECPADYVDDLNHSLYYTPENAANAFAACERLLSEYREKYQSRDKQEQVKRLKSALAELTGETKGETK